MSPSDTPRVPRCFGITVGSVGAPADVEGPHVVAAVTMRPSQIRPRRPPGIVAHQQLMAKRRGLPADSVEALRPAGPGHRRAQIDTRPAGQKIERFAEADTVGLLNKRQRIPRSATAEAVVEPPITVHRHRSSVAVRMERAHGHNRRGGAGPPDLGDLSDEVHKVGSFSTSATAAEPMLPSLPGVGNLRRVCTPPGSARPLAERFYQAQKARSRARSSLTWGFSATPPAGGAAPRWVSTVLSPGVAVLVLDVVGSHPPRSRTPHARPAGPARPCDGAPCYWVERRKRIPPNGAASAGPWFHAAAGWGDGSAEATAASPVGYRATRLGLGNAAPSAKGSLALTKGLARERARL